MIDIKWIYGIIALLLAALALSIAYPGQYESVSSAAESVVGMIAVGFMMLACPALAAHGAYTATLPRRDSDRSNGIVEFIFFAPPAVFFWWVFPAKIIAWF